MSRQAPFDLASFLQGQVRRLNEQIADEEWQLVVRTAGHIQWITKRYGIYGDGRKKLEDEILNP